MRVHSISPSRPRIKPENGLRRAQSIPPRTRWRGHGPTRGELRAEGHESAAGAQDRAGCHDPVADRHVAVPGREAARTEDLASIGLAGAQLHQARPVPGHARRPHRPGACRRSRPPAGQAAAVLHGGKHAAPSRKRSAAGSRIISPSSARRLPPPPSPRCTRRS